MTRSPRFASPPLLCFDLDGTLVDSAVDIASAVNQTLIDEGASPLPLEVVKSHIGEGVMRLLQGAFAEMNPDRLEILRARFYSHYEQHLTRSTRPYEGVDEFLRSWTGPMALITNKPSRFTGPLMEHLGWTQLPWVATLSADSLPERKPSPLPLRHVMGLAGRQSTETLMIGDGIPDLLSAQAAGVPSIAAHYGYTEPKILKEYNPFHSVEKFADFALWVASGP